VSGGVVRQCDSAKVRKGICAAVLRTIIALLVGVAITVALAWFGALWMVPSRTDAPVWEELEPPLMEEIGEVVVLVWSESYHALCLDRLGCVRRGPGAPKLGDPSDGVSSFPALGAAFVESRYGWPIYCMRATARYKYGRYPEQVSGLIVPQSELADAISVKHAGFIGKSPYRALPIEPIWPQFAACVATWSGLSWAVWHGARLVRSWVRRHRGVCVRCAYELRGLQICPECGASVSSTRVARVVVRTSLAGNTLIGGSP
jgi:hypothetical protein